jgi:NAD(P)-dependent dehydrogenase (short-subunit alcohol dehydrogenase family)
MEGRGWALVTGAARRIGRALALSAARAGFDVVVHYRTSSAAASETMREVESAGRRVVALTADLSRSADCRQLIARAPGPLRLLVNSASVFEEDDLESLRPEGWDGTLAVNLRAPVLLAQQFAARLPDGAEGLIVNLIDQRVLRPTPLFFSYAVSKSALWAATQMMAQALAPRCRVNAIAPGPTLRSTHQSPERFDAEAKAVLLGRGPTPEEMGEALAYFVDARAVTGQMIVVDGGQHLSWRTRDVVDGSPAAK